jgi:hypothetical protein
MQSYYTGETFAGAADLAYVLNADATSAAWC